jgi:hypothetical protein
MPLASQPGGLADNRQIEETGWETRFHASQQSLECDIIFDKNVSFGIPQVAERSR